MDTDSSPPHDPYAAMLKELRGPVASIQSYVRTLVSRDEELSHSARATVYQVLLQHAGRLDAVFDDVVLYLRLVTGGVDVRPEHFLLGGLLEEVRQGSGDAERVLVELPPSLAVHADRKALGAALRRLVRNGLVYGPRTGTVKVRASLVDGVPEITVSDTGRGIPGPHVDEALEPFTRAVAEDERRRDGAGLGLAVTRELVSLLDGELELRDNDPGLAAVVRLPAPSVNGPG